MTTHALNLWTNSRRFSALLDGVRSQVEAPSPSDVSYFVDPDPVRWITTHFYIPETKSPLQLAPYQAWALRHALTPDADGLYPYSVILWSDIKKSIKSCIAAAVDLWWMFQGEWRSSYIVANDLKQADSRVAYYMRRAIQLNPKLRAACKVVRYKTTLPNHSFIEAIPIDPTGEAGSNADMTVFSELWGAAGGADQQMWTEMTIPPNKFGKAWRWVETYAGFEGESELLERLYKEAVKPEQRIHADYEAYVNEPGRMFCLWNTQPRMPWQTAAYYAQQRVELDPSEFDRVHTNKWSAGSTQRFIPIMLWDACKSDVPPLNQWERTPIVLAGDAGISSDGFALAAISRHPIYPDHAMVRGLWVWYPAKGEKLDFGPIEQEIIDLCGWMNVVQITYDPWQLHDMMTRINNKGIAPTSEFSQVSERPISDKMLYDMIIGRRMHHDGNPELREAVDNADREVNKHDNQIRIVKRTHKKKIDPVIAVSMGVKRLFEVDTGGWDADALKKLLGGDR